MSEQENTRPHEDSDEVEAHRKRAFAANEDAPPAEGEQDEGDDVELHRRGRKAL